MEINDKATSCEILERIMWDYDIDPSDIYDFIIGKRNKLYHFTKEMIFIRILERLSWYEILSLFPLPILNKMIAKSTIKKLRSNSLREKYEYARRILHQESLPPSRWYYKDHKQHEYPLLSNRWYRS
jgi:hypothetical protein